MASRTGLAIFRSVDGHTLMFRFQSLADLGLPVNGADGIFLPDGPNGWAGDFGPMPEAR